MKHVQNPYGYPSIPNERRTKYLKLMDDLPRAAPLLFYLEENFPRNRIDDALSLLLRNGLTGSKLYAFYMDECGGSLLRFHKRILVRLQKGEVGPLIFGKDFGK